MLLLVIAIVIGLLIWLAEGMPAKLKTALTIAAVTCVIIWIFQLLGFDLVELLHRNPR